MAANTTIPTDFFTSASRMSITQIVKFFKDVVLKMDPKDVTPIILWGAPGCAKSEILLEIFANHEKGLVTQICSQLSPVDALGLAHIDDTSVENNGKMLKDQVTRFTPTEAFGRGKKNLFLDELNNASPSMLASIMNLLSSRKMGGDDYSNVILVAACNPPSTSSLAQDLAHPLMNRCMHIVVDYTIDDFLSYAVDSGTIHPAVFAFHKKTSGSFLQANWEVNKNRGYNIPEPGANMPFPSPRSYTQASKYLNAMSKTGGLDYSILRPILEGIVGPQAASEFATTYAYMTKLPDFKSIFDGKLNASEVRIKGEVVLEYLTTSSVINYISTACNDAKVAGVNCTPVAGSKVPAKNSPAWEVLAGIHRCIKFVNEACSPELSHMVIEAATRKVDSVLGGAWNLALYSDVDAANGLTKALILDAIASRVSDGRSKVSSSFSK